MAAGIGIGAGEPTTAIILLPAIPLLLAGVLSGRVILMERIGKKAAAVERIIDSLSLKAEVIPESFPWGPLKPGFDLITLKWVKLTPDLLSKIIRFLSPGGRLVRYSSESLSSEIIKPCTYTFKDPQTGVIKGFTVYQK